MSLKAFFREVGPYLQSQSTTRQFRKVGKTKSPDADLEMYPWLVRNDQQRIVGQLLPMTKKWCERAGIDWITLIAKFVADKPPSGFSVPTVGDGFSDWLGERRQRDPRLPVGIEAIADLGWTRYITRTAPDADDIGIDRRLFVRQYPIDVLATEAALRNDAPLPDPAPTTFVIFRREDTGRVQVLPATLASIAVLVSATGAPLEGALALPDATLKRERDRLLKCGALPRPFLGDPS